MLVECRYCSVCESFFDSVHEDCPYCELYKSYDKLDSEMKKVWRTLSENGISHAQCVEGLKQGLTVLKNNKENYNE
jgi:hypothetical protein